MGLRKPEKSRRSLVLVASLEKTATCSKSSDIALIRVEVNSDPGTFDLTISFMDHRRPGKDDGATGDIEVGTFTAKPSSLLVNPDVPPSGRGVDVMEVRLVVYAKRVAGDFAGAMSKVPQMHMPRPEHGLLLVVG
jgi:hypothetical protein